MKVKNLFGSVILLYISFIATAQNGGFRWPDGCSSAVCLTYDDAIFAVESVCKATSANVSSMLQDVLRHKRTEIDAINGAIVSEARKAGIEAPINETLTYLVKGIEHGT